MSQPPTARIPRWAWAGLVLILVFDTWYRGHTIGPTIVKLTGLPLWPVVSGRAEPLDCDEAVYAYIGRRIAGGAVMYRDLTENKPPGGYWLYALAAAIGGANELTIRLMPVPMVLVTIGLVWWIGYRIRGPGAACLAGFLYAILSTDPFVFGNGANMEHAINLFATASLAFMIEGLRRSRSAWFLGAGATVAAACLVKQIAILHLPVYLIVLLLAQRSKDTAKPTREKLRDGLNLALGTALVLAAAAAVLMFQGAGRAAYEDIFRYGAALATDTPPEPGAPPFLERCITGNADPSGGLPPPFGKSTYLVWWGTGSWPLWLVSIPAVVWLLFAPRTTAARRLVAGWTISACIQVVLPRLFWPHYYLLPTPGIALCVAACVGDAFARRVPGTKGRAIDLLKWGVGVTAIAATLATLYLQLTYYLAVPAEELTIRYKGGRQWVTLRSLSEAIRKGQGGFNPTRRRPDPRLFVWGWQSPLYLYTGFDGASRQVFVDPLIKAYATKNHPLIRPRVKRIMEELRANPPEVIFVGDLPFPELRDFLFEHYRRSPIVPQAPDGRGLWIDRGSLDAPNSAQPGAGSDSTSH